MNLTGLAQKNGAVNSQVRISSIKTLYEKDLSCVFVFGFGNPSCRFPLLTAKHEIAENPA